MGFYEDKNQSIIPLSISTTIDTTTYIESKKCKYFHVFIILCIISGLYCGIIYMAINSAFNANETYQNRKTEATVININLNKKITYALEKCKLCIIDNDLPYCYEVINNMTSGKCRLLIPMICSINNTNSNTICEIMKIVSQKPVATLKYEVNGKTYIANATSECNNLNMTCNSDFATNYNVGNKIKMCYKKYNPIDYVIGDCNTYVLSSIWLVIGISYILSVCPILVGIIWFINFLAIKLYIMIKYLRGNSKINSTNNLFHDKIVVRDLFTIVSGNSSV
jgi:hypothetical protein